MKGTKSMKGMVATMTTDERRTSTPAARQRPATGAPGVKLLITVGTIAGTVAGWTMFTEQEKAATQPAQANVPADSSIAVQSLAASLSPIPTLVPQPSLSGAASVAGQPASGVASAPIVVQQAPALRVVSQPPTFPVTRTRTSR